MIKSIISTLKHSLNSSHLFTNIPTHGFATFDCNNCSKKTMLPECTACHRMVNYFNIFNMYLYLNPVPNSTASTKNTSQSRRKNSKKSTIPTNTPPVWKNSSKKTWKTTQLTSMKPNPLFWMTWKGPFTWWNCEEWKWRVQLKFRTINLWWRCSCCRRRSKRPVRMDASK